MIKLLDRYVFKKLFIILFFIIIATVGIIEVIHFVMNSDTYITYNISIKEIASYYICLFPFMVNFILPIASFLAAVAVTLRMARNSEIIAAFSSGITLLRFARSYFILAFFLATFSFMLSNWIIPIANRTRIMFEINYLGRSQYSSFTDVHIKIGENKYVYVRSYDPYKIQGNDFTLETIDGEMKEKLSAEKITYQKNKGQWYIENWDLRKINGMNEELTTGLDKYITIDLSPSDFGDDYTIRRMLDFFQLIDYTDKLKSKDSDMVYLFLIEKYKRYMYPVSIFLLIFVGLIFSSRTMRRGMGMQIAISFVLGLGYVAFFMVSEGRAETHSDNILLTIWMPNILFSILVAVIYRFMPK